MSSGHKLDFEKTERVPFLKASWSLTLVLNSSASWRYTALPSISGSECQYINQTWGHPVYLLATSCSQDFPWLGLLGGLMRLSRPWMQQEHPVCSAFLCVSSHFLLGTDTTFQQPLYALFLKNILSRAGILISPVKQVASCRCFSSLLC